MCVRIWRSPSGLVKNDGTSFSVEVAQRRGSRRRAYSRRDAQTTLCKCAIISGTRGAAPAMCNARAHRTNFGGCSSLPLPPPLRSPLFEGSTAFFRNVINGHFASSIYPSWRRSRGRGERGEAETLVLKTRANLCDGGDGRTSGMSVEGRSPASK